MAQSENNLTAVLQDTADAIRSKTGSNGLICPRDFADEILNISGGTTPELVSKGDIIFMSGHRYRVLQANADNTDVELLLLDDEIASIYGNGTTTDFDVDGETKQGQKYEGSALDVAMNRFYEALDEDIQEAIIAQDRNQSMYAVSMGEMTEPDYTIEAFGLTYRYKKKSSVVVGSRNCYALDMDDIISYLGGTSAYGTDLNTMFFNCSTQIPASAWVGSADFAYSNYALSVSGYSGGVDGYFYYDTDLVRPAFHLNLSTISYINVN